MSKGGTKQPEIPGLTGLRFVAAMFVVLSHTLHSISGFNETSGLTVSLSQVSALGMTLFFVLSGFVIHYNYRDVLTYGGSAGYWSFFVARFARLYPLYALLLCTELYTSGKWSSFLLGNSDVAEKFYSAGPFYATMTQSWFFKLIGENNLIYQFDRVGSVSWSISTEWFFYLAYPVVALFIGFLRPTWTKITAILLLSATALWMVWLVISHMPEIDAYALSHFGTPASITPLVQDSLYRWILYFSPYSRVTEFILGALVCAIYMDLANTPSTPAAQRIGTILTIAALVAIAVTHFMLLDVNKPFEVLTPYHMVYGYALPVALLIFCIARYKSFISSFLAWKPVVLAGEISYSLYFLHLIVLAWLSARGFMSVPSGSITHVWGVALVASGLAVVLSFISYNLIEVPSRIWFRRVLSESRGGVPEKRTFHIAAAFSRGLVLLCLIVVPLAILVLSPPPKLLPPPDGTIEILEASYGRSCGVPRGNVSKSLIDACSGTRSCQYTVDVFKLGDPAGGCSKDFSVKWRCSRDGREATESVPEEAGLGGKSIALTCPFQDGTASNRQ